MPSDRLRHVYNDSRWNVAREEALDRAGHQCTHIFTNVFGEQVRCTALNGGLTVDHIDPFGDPFDQSNLQVLCRRHHGQKDGGRRRNRSVW